MTETPIPDDIMARAKKVADDLEASDCIIQDDGYIHSDGYEIIARAILAERERHGWQPIGTAPRDGTVIDLLTKSGDRFTEEWWIENEGGFWSCDFLDDKFTHWMPLPSPPNPPTGEEP